MCMGQGTKSRPCCAHRRNPSSLICAPGSGLGVARAVFSTCGSVCAQLRVSLQVGPQHRASSAPAVAGRGEDHLDSALDRGGLGLPPHKLTRCGTPDARPPAGCLLRMRWEEHDSLDPETAQLQAWAEWAPSDMAGAGLGRRGHSATGEGSCEALGAHGRACSAGAGLLELRHSALAEAGVFNSVFCFPL